MSNEQPNSKMKPAISALVAPLVTLALLVVFWRLGQKWVVLPAALLLILFYLIVPKIIRRKAAKFHKEALKLLATGKARQVPELARKNLFLQILGPSGPIDAKLGMAYSQIENYPAAVGCLENGLSTATAQEAKTLKIALIKALFITGNFAQAKKIGEGIIKQDIQLPEAMAIVARTYIEQGRIDNRTLQLLNQAEKLSPSDDVKLMLDLCRIEAALLTGKKYNDVPDAALTKQRFLKVWTLLVRGQVRQHKGKLKDAIESYEKAIKLGKEEGCWFSIVAEEKLEKISAQVSQKAKENQISTTPASKGQDPAIKRKKKKRR